jgi:hypothetical protein
MRGLLFGSFFILAAATAVFYFASMQPQGWAIDVCRVGFDLCEHVTWLAAATAVTAVLFVVVRSGER